MLFDGFSHDQRWAAIKEVTQHPRTLTDTLLHDMAIRYEMRKELGLLPPEYTFPSQNASPSDLATAFTPWERRSLPELLSGAVYQQLV